MNKVTSRHRQNLEGKGLNVPGTKLVFQITRYRMEKRSIPWTDYTAVCAFSDIKDAQAWISSQRTPENYRIERKNLIQLEGRWYPVNAYTYKVKIDDPTAPDVVLDQTGMRASPRKYRKENYEQADKAIRHESDSDGGCGDQGPEVGITTPDVPKEEF